MDEIRSHQFETMRSHCFLGVNIPGFLNGGAKWISQPSITYGKLHAELEKRKKNTSETLTVTGRRSAPAHKANCTRRFRPGWDRWKSQVFRKLQRPIRPFLSCCSFGKPVSAFHGKNTSFSFLVEGRQIIPTKRRGYLE